MIFGSRLLVCFPSLSHPVLDDIGLDIELPGHGVYIYLALDGVGNIGYRVGDLVNEVGLLERVVARFFQQKMGLERDAVLLVVGNELANLLQRMLLRERVGVVAVGQEHHLGIHALLEDEADGP